jgi:hypothetical protein
MDEEIRKHLAILQGEYLAIQAELIRLHANHEATKKVLATHLGQLTGKPWQQILQEAEELGKQLYDGALLRAEDVDPGAAALIDGREREEDFPDYEGRDEQ